MSTASSAVQRDPEFLSAECAVGSLAGYEALYAKCRQTEDIPMSHGGRLLLMRRCPCVCHAEGAE